MYSFTLSFLVTAFLFPQISQQDYVIQRVFRRAPVTPYYHVCPGVDDLTENIVSLGIMLSLPSAVNDLNVSTTTLIPGELVIPLSPNAMAAFKQGTIINQERSILPNHTLCLYFSFVPNDLQDTSLGSNYLYTHSSTYQTINGLTDPYQFRVNRDLMVSFGNMVNVLPPPTSFQCPVFPYAFNVSFCEADERQYDSSCELGVFDTNIEIHFTSIQLVSAARQLMGLFGWKRYGILTTCSNQEVWQHENLGLFLSQYTNGNFLKSFQLFQENEISVILFLGNICSYFDFLMGAYDYGLVSTGKFVFITVIQDFNPNAHLTNAFTGMCENNFTNDEVLKIKRSINKTIIVYPRCICRYGIDDLSDPNLSMLERCMQLYMSDAVTLSAIASEVVLEQKSKERGVDVSLLSIEKADYASVTQALFNSSFYGRTGFLEFDTGCHRVSNVFAASNILVNEENLTLRLFDGPLDIRAYILTRRSDELDVVTFVDNETDINTNQFLFQDNTTNVPRDSPKRFYFRDNSKAFGVIFAIGIGYITLISLYIVFIYYHNGKVLKYSENWLVEEKDLNPVGLCGMFSQSWQAEKFSCPASDGSVTKVYNNGLVQVYKCDDITVREAASTSFIRKDIMQTMELSHPNLCCFNGCVSNNLKIVGIMFEHTGRKNVYELLTNPHLELNETNRNTFCQDIINGLQYLHCNKISHGRLHSVNCLIDENWNVKLTNFGVHTLFKEKSQRASLYKPTTVSATIAVEWKAPECRLLALPPNMKADIFSLGALFKVIASRHSLISINSQQVDSCGIAGGKTLTFDDDVPIILKQLVESCMSNSPNDRPSLEMVKNEMKDILSLEQRLLKNECFGTLEMYSSNLEKQVELALTELENEQEFSDTVLSNYIPETVISKARKGIPMPVVEYKNGILLYIRLNQFNELFSKCASDVATGVISNIDKLLINVSKRCQLERVQYNGSLWVYVGGVYTNGISEMSTLTKAVKAGLEILEEFQQQQDEVTLTVALHSGALMCGLMNETNQVHITAGDVFHEGLRLISLAPAMRVCISEQLKEKLEIFRESQDMFVVEKCKSFKIDNDQELNIYEIVDNM